MAGETQITVVGNLTADPELRYTAQSVPVASFTVASTPRTYNRASGQWEDGTAMFLRCSAWREMAENIAESLTKGMRVMVHGRLFGAVSTQDVVAAVKEQIGQTIDRRKVIIEKPIKAVGKYQIQINLHEDISAKLFLNVEGSK